MKLNRRDFSLACLSTGLLGKNLLAQAPQVGAPGRSGRGRGPGGAFPGRKTFPPPQMLQAKTTVMWQVPAGAGGKLGAPNGLAMDERGRGIWYGEEEGPTGDRTNCEAVLLDLNGKELKRLHTPATNVSGMGEGGGYIWMGSGRGYFQVNIDTNEITPHDMPLDPPGNPTGGSHGIAWDDENQKVWIAHPQLGLNIRVDPKSFEADRAIKIDLSHFTRVHGTAYHQGFLYQVGWRDNVDGAPSTHYNMGHGGITKYDANTGAIAAYIDFEPNSIDPHCMTIDKDGKIYVADAGFHPNIPDRESPYTGVVGYVTLL